jgi:hypothetical protein
VKRCWQGAHLPGCRAARPLCRWRRKVQPKYRVCRCDAYHFPHRSGSLACKLGVFYRLIDGKRIAS